MTEFQLMLFLIGVHVFGFVAVGLLMIPVLRDDPSESDDDGGSSDDGWGNRPNVKPDPSRWPGGGIPLPDAEQSSIRLREPGRIGEKLTRPERRPAREPAPNPTVPAND
jgi:hypothetical protein